MPAGPTPDHSAPYHGQEVRRNYSICTSATSGELAIGVRHIAGGMFSTFALETLRAGDVLELMTPAGSFGAPLDPFTQRDYVAVAAGSGITPILSIIRTTMEIETESRFILFHRNKTAESTMFATELDELESAMQTGYAYSTSARTRHTTRRSSWPDRLGNRSTAARRRPPRDRPVVPVRPERSRHDHAR
ncbi:FAD-binding oxidoreductase [Nocardia asiatica]|uniref:FAD-binding oxidoreductase n=1 Tax=Nocardia asiatica TaxID=209252 RepID=UPI003EE2759A